MARTVEVFPIKGGKPLLIEKLRGFGAGNFVGPGGKLERNEASRDAAKREVWEEVGISLDKEKLSYGGRILFLSGKESVENDYFLASPFFGTPKETDEARPRLFSRLPYSRMWADSRFWVRRALSGESLSGTFSYSPGWKRLLSFDSMAGARLGTIVFLRKGGKILLIRKKRGIGAGLYNGAGGHVEPYETPEEGAKREVGEELEVRAKVRDLREMATLDFIFGGRPFMRVFAYSCSKFSGRPAETEEAEPFWFDIDEIPYGKMWEDDSIWLPEVLAGRRVYGKFSFDESGKKMLGRGKLIPLGKEFYSD